MRFFLIISLMVPGLLNAATYYVATNGLDAQVGSEAEPWLTISKAASTMVAGDTVIIGPGDYDEYVTETTSGSSGSRIVFRASSPHLTTLRGFRPNADFITLDGLKITRFSGVGVTTGAPIYIDAGSHDITITNCVVADSPVVTAFDLWFDSTDNEIQSLSSDFIAAGFKAGSKIYLGASGMDGYWYTNHNTGWVISNLTATSMWVTNATGDSFAADAGTNYWGIINPGATGTPGNPAIKMNASGGVIPTNFVFTHSMVSNYFGKGIEFQGTDGLIISNCFTRLQSFAAIQHFQGNNTIIRGNIIKTSPNVLNYTGDEVAGLIHPGGSDWYDYQQGMFSTFAQSAQNRTNILIEGNWMEDIDNQMGRVDDEDPTTWGLTWKNNVFIGVSAQMSGGRDYMRWISNTFYRCSYDNILNPLSLGGRPPLHTNYVIFGNLFSECGQTNRSDGGWYSISTNAIIEVADSNYVAGFEVFGYPAKTGFQITAGDNSYSTEPNGINGGDPGFVNPLDPDGPDDIPFTDDDGLKVLPNAATASLGGGALGIKTVVNNEPIAHFRLTSPTGWFEELGSNYNPRWWTNAPMRRGQSLRPYRTHERVGTNLPVTLTFNAELSLSGVGGSITNTAITNYSWAFGDGTYHRTNHPITSHVYNRPGEMMVLLSVANTAGNTHTFSNIYQLAGTNVTYGTNTLYVAMDGDDSYDGSFWYPMRTIGKALTNATAGFFVLVGPGEYNENVDTENDGTASLPIVIDGQNMATNREFNLEHDYNHIINWTMIPNAGALDHVVQFNRGANFNMVSNNWMDLAYYSSTIFAISFVAPTVKPFGADAASWNGVYSNMIYRGLSQPMIAIKGTSNIISGNVITGGDYIDAAYIQGYSNVFSFNVFTNNFLDAGGGNHPDFVQTLGDTQFFSKTNAIGAFGNRIEGNFVDGIPAGGVTQFETHLSENVSDFYFINNTFMNISQAASCSVPGVKYWNNLFINCGYSTSPAITFGSRFYGLTNAPSGTLIEGQFYGFTGTSGDALDYDGTELIKGSSTYKIFRATATSTYTITTNQGSAEVVYGEYSRAHRAEALNNIFFRNGTGSTNRGWYSFETDVFTDIDDGITDPLTNVIADYNMVTRTNFLNVTPNSLQSMVGDGAPNYWDNTKWWEDNGINGGNPGFVDTNVYNFHLEADSIVIGAGTNLSSIFTTDKDGVTRSSWDIGPFEYVEAQQGGGGEPSPTIRGKSLQRGRGRIR